MKKEDYLVVEVSTAFTPELNRSVLLPEFIILDNSTLDNSTYAFVILLVASGDTELKIAVAI